MKLEITRSGPNAITTKVDLILDDGTRVALPVVRAVKVYEEVSKPRSVTLVLHETNDFEIRQVDTRT
jgi:hypothetical protein